MRSHSVITDEKKPVGVATFTCDEVWCLRSPAVIGARTRRSADARDLDDVAWAVIIVIRPRIIIVIIMKTR